MVSWQRCVVVGTITRGEYMNDYLSVCIWGNGPGRPYDNIYLFQRIEYVKDIVHMFFCNGEECIIVHPQNLLFSQNGLKISYADKIIWKFYYYGKPQSDETLVTMEYIPMGNSKIRISVKGAITSDRTISSKGIAFDSFGHIKAEQYTSLQ